MAKFVLILVAVGVVVWVWFNRREKLLRLLNRAVDALPDQGGERAAGKVSLAGAHRAELRESGPLVEAPRKLSPLDVPTIQARFEKLGIWAAVNEYQAETLRRLVLEACKEGREALWWSPLVAFARHLDYQKADVPVSILDARRLQVVDLRRSLLALDYQIRGRDLRLDDVSGGDGRELQADETLAEGTYAVVYRLGERAFRFPLAVAPGRLDVLDLVRRINGLLTRRQAANRLVVLPPMGDLWCVVCCVFSAAEQAHRAGWGQLAMPLGAAEPDEEIDAPQPVGGDQ